MDTSKIIKGVVNSGRYTVTAPIVKEDYGLYLKIEGVELPSTYEVDFSNNENSGTSVTMIGNSEGVLIPREFIETGKDIFAFLYVVGINYGRTVYKFRIPNKLRPDRTNIAPTPEEQSVIDQAISALNEAVAQTAQDVIDADASAQNASADAERAEEARTDAQNYADMAEQARDDAQTYANNASASATASAQSASQSAQIKADVEDLVDDAQGYAQASAQSATASANSATTAQGYANTASASAQSASTSASDALTYANTASAKATEASTSAQTASTKATEASQSAENALSYKTDAESAKTASQTAQGLAESARDTAVSAKTDAESARDDAVQAKEDAQSAVASISGALAEKAPVITDTASGAIASFSDGADDLPLKSLVVDINPVQDLSNGDPSPENICPISGWTGAEVEQRGKNLANLSFSDNVPSIYTGEMVPNAGWSTDFIRVFQNCDYIASFQTQHTNYVLFYDANKTYLGYTNSFSGVYSPNSNAYWSQTAYVKLRADGTENESTKAQLELGSTATPYSPYTGRSITINLGQTVYGGKLDVLSGVLVIDRVIADLSTLGFTYNSGWNCWTIGSIADSKAPIDNNTPIGAISDRLTAVKASGYTSSHQSGTVARNTGGIWFVDNGSTTELTGQLCYELATPITIQLSPNQVNSLLGVNNIWADSGDTTAEYRADTKLYIAKKIAEAISALS